MPEREGRRGKGGEREGKGESRWEKREEIKSREIENGGEGCGERVGGEELGRKGGSEERR